MRQHRSLLLILGAVVATAPLSIDMYLPSLPTLQAHFDVDAASVQLTLSTFFIGLAIGQVFYGPVSDRIGRLGPLYFGLSVYVLASAACVLAPTVEALTVARLFQALGGCAGIVITRAIVRDRFAPQEMAQALSTLVMIMGAAPILAPMIGAQLLVYLGWQSIFVFLTVFGLLCIVLIYRGLEESWVPPAQPLHAADVLGTYGRLLGHRRFMGFALAGSTAQAGMFAYIATSSFVFIEIYGLAPSTFGWIFGVNAAGLITASQVNSRLLRRHRSERVLRGALAANTLCGGAMLLMAMTGTGGIWGIAVPLFGAISSLGFSFPNSTAAAMAPFGDRAGMAAALLGTLQFTIAAVVTFLVGYLHDGTALPLAAVIFACGSASYLLLRTLTGPHAAAAA
ncbi:MAG: multidrug effflux MFS transporter [Gammaproteobacteria bacterium]|nr:multidrug effflux MFS transporter [Gammaproteobacteria bacterium]